MLGNLLSLFLWWVLILASSNRLYFWEPLVYILSSKSLFLGSASQFGRNSSSAHYPRFKLDMFQGQSYAAAAQIFILLGPLLFLSFCQHFRKFPTQAQVTRLGGSSLPLAVALALKYQRATARLKFLKTFLLTCYNFLRYLLWVDFAMAILNRIHHINLRVPSLTYYMIQTHCMLNADHHLNPAQLLPSHRTAFQWNINDCRWVIREMTFVKAVHSVWCTHFCAGLMSQCGGEFCYCFWPSLSSLVS